MLDPDRFAAKSGIAKRTTSSSASNIDEEMDQMAEITDEFVAPVQCALDEQGESRGASRHRGAMHFTDRRVPLETIASTSHYHDEAWLVEHWTSGFRSIKRAMDVGFSILMLFLCSPVIVIMAILIRLDSPGSIIYSQYRIGLGGHLFRIYKFRTMRHDAEVNGPLFSSKDDPRITRVGGFMRRTRIDELPQFWNVIQGTMSIIGPRPERPEHEQVLEAEIPGFALRTAVKPGLTGWAQVCAPYASTVQESAQKLEYDLYYIRNASVWMDLQIAWRTIMVVLRGGGV